MTHYVLMAKNNAWANARLYDVLCDLDSKQFAAKRPGFFPSLSKTMHHILEVDLYYLNALDGRAGQMVQCKSPVELSAAQMGADTRLTSYCQRLTDDTLASTVLTDRGAAGMVAERVDRLLLHLFQHQIHHRGQAHVQLSHAGLAPPQLDEFFLDFDRHPTATSHD